MYNQCLIALIWTVIVLVAIPAAYFATLYTGYGITYAWAHKLANMTTGCPLDTKYSCAGDSRLMCYDDQGPNFYAMCPFIGSFVLIFLAVIILVIVVPICIKCGFRGCWCWCCDCGCIPAEDLSYDMI